MTSRSSAMRYSACIEWLFAAEVPQFADRIRAARDAGLHAVEFWRYSNKDVDAVEAALRETGLPLAGLLCEPVVPLTDPEAHEQFLEGLRSSLLVAQRLGAKVIIAQAGDDLPGRSRTEQHAAIVRGLRSAASLLEDTDIVLALEPLNDRVDHPGYYLTSTVEGLDIVDEVDRPEIRLLYDIYHSAVMGEDTEEVLAGRLDRVAHVHLADLPGRGEPGSGRLDFEHRLRWLQDAGYGGYVGLEYRPSGSTADSLRLLRKEAQ
jgi:hydroxypyruvate isomerase